jgi:hypothetical protein
MELEWPQLSLLLVVVYFINSLPSNRQLGSGVGDLAEPCFCLGLGWPWGCGRRCRFSAGLEGLGLRLLHVL